MKTITLAVLATFALVGCASTDYKHYKEIQVEIAKAEAARYSAMARIAESGDSTTKVAAMFALQGGKSGSTTHIAAPKSLGEEMLQWAGIILPTAVQAYGINANKQISVTNSNNAAATAASTNNAFVELAKQIQAPAANVTTTNTMSGTGVMGSGSYTTSANPVTTTTTTSTTTSTTDDHSIVNPPGGKVCAVDGTTGAVVCQ
jgi:hypothetical protein